MQPFVISTRRSSVRERAASPSRTSAASMFTSLMSLTMTATRSPSRLLRRWLRSVVLPDPRKPDRTVTGSWTDMAGAVLGAQQSALVGGDEAPRHPVFAGVDGDRRQLRRARLPLRAAVTGVAPGHLPLGHGHGARVLPVGGVSVAS